MSTRVVPINWADLETAFERNAPDTESFVDLKSGDVVTVCETATDYKEVRQKVQNGGDQFLRVEPAASREQYKWMERFVAGVTDEPLRERLIISIDGKGAFRRFKDVLINYPAERERWFSYRGDILHWHMQKWLEKEKIEPKEPAPWGVAPEPPNEEVVLERPAAQAEGPGEILRRQAKELVDNIPAVELPAAIAFLEFLRERGIAELGRVRSLPPKRTAA